MTDAHWAGAAMHTRPGAASTGDSSDSSGVLREGQGVLLEFCLITEGDLFRITQVLSGWGSVTDAHWAGAAMHTRPAAVSTSPTV